MGTVRIVHLSDLHISEHLMREPDIEARWRHRYGHDVKAFQALDRFLRDRAWHILLITGDISRVGSRESFEWARNWLENEVVFGDTRLGLNLSKSPARRYLVVPGNHDRFNGKMTQGSLDNFNGEFPTVRRGSVTRISVDGETINAHLFDSSAADGGFAYGRLDQRSMVAKDLREDEIDLALLHHHFLQPPKHPREITTELMNSADVAAYMLNAGFDAVFFGHTHKGYIGRPSVEILSGLLNDRRKRPRMWTRLIPKYFLRRNNDESLVSYRREPAQNGQLPTLAAYFDYLYLKQKGHAISGPGTFNNIRDFYAHLNAIKGDTGIAQELARVRVKRMLISLAPSACQAEAEWNGLHTVTITRQPDKTLAFEWDRYEFDGVSFALKPRDQHVS